MVIKAAALTWGPHGVTVLSLHPGWVKTDMGGAAADIDPPTSIAGMKQVIAAAGATQNGLFFDYRGQALVW